MTDAAAAKSIEFISRFDLFSGVITADFEECVKSGKIEYISDEVYESFFTEVLKARVNPGICEKAGLSVIYTPHNVTGNKPVRINLKMIGVEDVTDVPE